MSFNVFLDFRRQRQKLLFRAGGRRMKRRRHLILFPFCRRRLFSTSSRRRSGASVGWGTAAGWRGVFRQAQVGRRLRRSRREGVRDDAGGDDRAFRDALFPWLKVNKVRFRAEARCNTDRLSSTPTSTFRVP